MSHFTVMVISTSGIDNVDEQLKPFDENIQVPKYTEGPVSQEELDDFVKYYTEKTTNLTEEQRAANKLKSFDDLYAEYGDQWNGGIWQRSPDGTYVEVSTYNPKSKWDWYQLGGRWPDRLLLKDGSRVDQASFDLIDWDKIRQTGEQEYLELWNKMEQATAGLEVPAKSKSQRWTELRKDYKGDYGVIRDQLRAEFQGNAWYEAAHNPDLAWGTDPLEFFALHRGGKEIFLEEGRNVYISTYAVLRDGNWCAPGDMGWWGISSESEDDKRDWNAKFFDRFLKDLPPKALISIVDCHI